MSLITTLSHHQSEGKLQKHNSGMIVSGPDTSEIKIWATSSGREPQPTEVLAEDKGYMKWVIEEDSYK